MNGMEKFSGSTTLLGALLGLGLVLGGWTLGTQIKATRLNDRYVDVKGLVERTVKADLVTWPLSYKEAGDDLASLYDRSETDRKSILQFLAEQGIQPSEIELSVVQVTDTEANEYGGKRGAKRYILGQEIKVRTSRVDQVATAAQRTMLLVHKGIVLNSTAAEYKFTGLNSIKPDMITEATRNARAAATRFAADSGSKVGSIRYANQGAFSIEAADQIGGTGEDGYGSSNGDSSLMKTVRVVTSVQYYLER